MHFDSSTITTSIMDMRGLDRKMIVGYARTSTVEQVSGFEAQVEELKKIGAEKIFQEQVSSLGKREQLDAALAFVREDDIFVVTKLDRLARSVQHLCQIVADLEKKKASLRILNINLDTASPTGKLMLNLLASVAQFEVEMMKERQKVGVQAAKAAGKYKGRKPTARAKAAEILQLIAQGNSRQKVAEQMGVSVASVYRVLAQQKAAAAL